MKRRFVVTLLLFLFAVTSAWAVPTMKQLYYTKDTTLTTGQTYTFRFSLWNVGTGGSAINMVWSEDQNIAMPTQTLKAYLGKIVPLDQVDFSRQYWVMVEVLDPTSQTYSEVGTRTRLQVVPYALWSNSGGDVTSVTAGNGLSAAATNGDVTLNVGAGTGIKVAPNAVSVDTAVIQKRVTGTCPSGSAISSIDASGAVVTCEQGIQGPAGPQGPTGPQGPQGPAGPAVHTSAVCVHASADGDRYCSCAVRTISRVQSNCTVTSDTGSCSASDSYGTFHYHGQCCVCAP